ncbi:hypothetical protein Tsp_04967 [Trichinella spiralis]|uniref:hypothetical protein n=1 Tax=Trichinella spiralis TaxID=6334 RepID=UPI0001EFE763|nr:hypothetical protein Tsp_04967 [Trichinella spiralis]
MCSEQTSRLCYKQADVRGKMVSVDRLFGRSGQIENGSRCGILTLQQKEKLDQTLSIAIYKCANSVEGDLIQLEMAEITENVQPHPHYFVPWILINDLSTTQLQIYQNGLFNFLCDPHSGSVPKGSAEFTNFFKQRKNLQCSARRRYMDSYNRKKLIVY